ncbi:hypothetical protein HGRIS_012994 [Hohenbuehelia grisea]|uniref:MYND-type domain-containing protein n=1 Tax=Hohenbuehelia grisea TaxID=104357 RepID=A0ABR3IU32_9AGAR
MASVFSTVYEQARQLVDAENSKDPAALSALDFSEEPQCWHCHKTCIDEQTKRLKPLFCSGCRAIIYCSSKCQTASWKKDPQRPQSIPHKAQCPELKADMALVQHVKSHLMQFPWGRIEKDGTTLSVLGTVFSDSGPHTDTGRAQVVVTRLMPVTDCFQASPIPQKLHSAPRGIPMAQSS